MQLYLCRHGETEWTVTGQHTGRTDLPLTLRGQEQTRYLRKRLQPIHFEKVFSSPASRAVESCAGLEPTLDAALMEWDYGDYEGLTSAEIHEKNPKWNLFQSGAPGGESVEDVGKRADHFLKRVSQFKGNVAVFSHGHFLRVLAARFLGLEAEMGKFFLLSVASLSLLGYEKEQPVVILWNSAFLEGISSKAEDGRRRERE
jgi:broad specificity phosphatase PhoE